jgi:hypothetical protein
MLHVMKDMLHVTRDMLHVISDTLYVINILYYISEMLHAVNDLLYVIRDMLHITTDMLRIISYKLSSTNKICTTELPGMDIVYCESCITDNCKYDEVKLSKISHSIQLNRIFNTHI